MKIEMPIIDTLMSLIRKIELLRLDQSAILRTGTSVLVDPLPKALDRGFASVAVKTGAFFFPEKSFLS